MAAEAPEPVRRRSARMLGGTLGIQSVLALGGSVLHGVTRGVLDPLVAAGIVTFLIAAPAGVLEWRRDHRGEALAALAFAMGALTSALLLVNAYWYYVPVLGLVTLLLMLLLMYRVAVRSEVNVQTQRQARQH